MIHLYLSLDDSTIQKNLEKLREAESTIFLIAYLGDFYNIKKLIIHHPFQNIQFKFQVFVV